MCVCKTCTRNAIHFPGLRIALEIDSRPRWTDGSAIIPFRLHLDVNLLGSVREVFEERRATKPVRVLARSADRAKTTSLSRHTARTGRSPTRRRFHSQGSVYVAKSLRQSRKPLSPSMLRSRSTLPTAPRRWQSGKELRQLGPVSWRAGLARWRSGWPLALAGGGGNGKNPARHAWSSLRKLFR